MDIARLEYKSSQDSPPTSLGLHIQKISGLTTVNLFALAENEGAPVSNQLWGIAHTICTDILANEQPEDINWTLTTGDRSSHIKFSQIGSAPLKLEISDMLTLRDEIGGRRAYPLERYSRDFDGQPPFDVSKGRVRELVREPDPASLFAIPCSNPNLPDGVVYCQPSYYDADHMRDDYEFIVADTSKLLELLRQSDKRMMDHANRQFSGSTADEWVEKGHNGSIKHPIDTGLWSYRSYSQKDGLNFCSGQAAYLKLFTELDLPFVPIAVEKALGPANINELRSLVAYGPQSESLERKIKPAFLPAPSNW